MRSAVAAETRDASADHRRDNPGGVDSSNARIVPIRDEQDAVPVNRNGVRTGEASTRRGVTVPAEAVAAVAGHRGDGSRDIQPSNALIALIRNKQVAGPVDRHAGRIREAYPFHPAIRDLLVSRQQKDGSWMDPVSSEYGTAMAAIILQMPDNSVPIFQR